MTISVNGLVSGIPASSSLTNSQTDSLLSLINSQPTISDQSSNIGRVQAVYYKLNEGSGTNLTENGADGPSITVGGTTTGIWANANCLTHDAAGNTIQVLNNPYIDGLVSMASEGSILIGADIWYTVWPTATETMWSIHRPDASTGGVRLPLLSGAAGRFGVYYKSNGGVESEVIGFTMASGFTGAWVSTLTELRVVPSKSELHLFLYINGRMERSNVISLATAPARDANGGLKFTGYGAAAPSSKLGSSGAGTPGNNCRTRLCYVLRHSGTDRSIAERLASYVYTNSDLPSWLVRV